jgi:hypothetical protein
MNFFELKATLSGRGYNYLSQEQQGNYINRARARLDNMYLWPYRLTTTTSIATIADMGQVASVLDTSQTYALEEVGGDDLIHDYDLTTTGSPTFWYRTPFGVATYPVTTDTITVRYWKRTPVLTETDTPLSPSDYHLLIVDMAQQMAERDRGNIDTANAMQPSIDQGIQEMVNDLLPQNSARFVRLTGASSDW